MSFNSVTSNPHLSFCLEKLNVWPSALVSVTLLLALRRPEQSQLALFNEQKQQNQLAGSPVWTF